MAVEPRYPQVQAALLGFLDEWCRSHPRAEIVRFTSLFYNFCWIWSDDPARRDVFSDWGSYDFTVNPLSLRAFEAQYGYRMTSEDFVRAGRYNPTHTPPTRRIKDWMAFTGEFVRKFGRRCVDLVHRYGKKAYVFYDDSWIGLEPWSEHFEEFGFDGLIKCVFNAFEARLCAQVPVAVHELRLHPYLFPTGLSGEPTFAPGGRPDADARRHWISVRRALLRVPVERIGLGGYLHLAEPFPAFQEEMARIADQFRLLRALHREGAPWSSGIRVGVAQAWGPLRTWSCAGHLHEHPELPLNHLYEALAGLPVEVRALSLEETARQGVPDDVDVLINAGREGDAWSGGDVWLDSALRSAVNQFVARGGAVIGVGEPAAARGEMRYFQMADILGVDREIGATICQGKYALPPVKGHFIIADAEEAVSFPNGVEDVYALDGQTQVLAGTGDRVRLATHRFGAGRAVYLNGFTHCSANARLLYRAILWASGREQLARQWICADPRCECAYFPDSGKLVVVNNAPIPVQTQILTPEGAICVRLEGDSIAVKSAAR